MIRCIRMWTGPDGHSTFKEGSFRLGAGSHGRASGLPIAVRELSFQETASGASFGWHQAPEPQFVITLGGTVEFEVRSGATFVVHPGDVLIAQDVTGSGHRWRLIGNEPWRRAYAVYQADANLYFEPKENQA